MREQKITLLAFSLILLVIIINAIFSYRATTTLINNQHQVAQTHEVINSLAFLFSTLKDAETGQRGYILTGKESYLQPYKDAVSKFNEEAQIAQELTKNNPDQQRRLTEIKKLSLQKLAELEETVKLKQDGKSNEALAVVNSDKGKNLMDSIRSLITDGEFEAQELLAFRAAESEASGRHAIVTFLIVNLLAFSFVGIALFLHRREIKIRRQAHKELEQANFELENRVLSRTQQLEILNDNLRTEIKSRQQVQEKLENLNIELERSNRELQDFAFVASHDLQEPLRKIQAFGDLLNTEFSKNLGSEGIDFVTRMQNAAQRMHVLINDLLAFSRVTTQAQPFVPIKLKNIVDEVINDLETRIKQNNGRVNIINLPEIEADPLQMRQLFQNLIANALKFHRSEIVPIVKVDSKYIPKINHGSSSDERTNSCQIIVSDNGIGFDEKYLDRIFTPFQRLHSRGEYEGTGMGLAVCRKIVERHGGNITAKSKIGEGSTFLITLPVRHSKGTAKP